MLTDREVISTIEMLKNEHLDVRAVTLGISLFDCVCDDFNRFSARVLSKITTVAENLVTACDEIGDKYGIPVVNKRISVSPAAVVAGSFDADNMVKVAHVLDRAGGLIGVDFVGGFSALVEKGTTPGDQALIAAIPRALSETRRVCSSVNVASSKAGINMDAVALMGRTIRQAAELSADRDGVACAKLVVFSNIPRMFLLWPALIWAWANRTRSSTSGSAARAWSKKPLTGPWPTPRTAFRPPLGSLSEVIKRTAYKVTRVGEIIGREVAARLGVRFGVVDLSLAPAPQIGDSVGEIFQSLGLSFIGAPGSTAVLALLNDAVKKGGAFASSHVGGLSGAFIPVSEDLNIAEAAAKGHLSLEKLEAMTSVCSVGLDMVAIPGDTSAATIAAIIADEMAIGMVNQKTTAVRIIPAPGKKVGDKVSFGGLLGQATVMPVQDYPEAERFISLGGRIPAPIHSLKN